MLDTLDHEPHEHRRPLLHVTLESHGTAATAYVHGALSAAGVLLMMRDCELLPTTVRALRVDLRAVRRYDAGALDVLTVALRMWRTVRSAATRIEMAREHEVAIPYLRDSPERCVGR